MPFISEERLKQRRPMHPKRHIDLVLGRTDDIWVEVKLSCAHIVEVPLTRKMPKKVRCEKCPMSR